MGEFPVEAEVSRDTLFSGELVCLQHSYGYRYSIDAVLLAHFIAPKAKGKILDLGAGCGVVSLILAYRFPSVSFTCLEIQKKLISLIRKNRELNSLQERLTVLQGDLVSVHEQLQAGTFDWVVCNPPYGKIGCGRKNPGREQEVARHEVKATLADVVNASFFCLKNKGKAAFVYPASRAAALLAALKDKGLEPKRMQCVYSYPGSSGKLLLVEAVKNGGEELVVLPPFFIFQEPGGEYSEEMARCYAK